MNCPECHRGMKKLNKNTYACFNDKCPNKYKPPAPPDLMMGPMSYQ